MSEREIDPLSETVASGPGAETVGTRHLRSRVKAVLFGSEGADVRIGRFRVQRKLGEGGMGVVFAAHDEELDRAVAIKLLRGGGGGDMARLQREARSMARLSHPNVAAIYDVGTHDGDVYVAMELVEGESLRAWLETPRSWSEIRDVMRQAAAGLQAAHDVGLVHRDFKPDNVMVGRDRRVRVLDFGLAKLGEAPEVDRTESSAPEVAVALTQTGTVMGTPRYMAPEQFRGEPVDAAADQFAFCVSLYEAVWGARPFDGDSMPELAEAAMSATRREPPARAGIPEGLWPIVQQGLLPAAKDRHTSVRSLVEAIDGIDAVVPAPARPIAARRRIILALVSVVAAALVGALTILGQQQRERSAAIAPAEAAPLEPAASETSTPFGDLGPLPTECPEGTRRHDDEGCKPTTRCERGEPADERCRRGEVACCRLASIPIDFERLEARRLGNERLDRTLSRDLSELLHHGCRLGDANACAQAGSELADDPAAALYSARACALSRTESCDR